MSPASASNTCGIFLLLTLLYYQILLGLSTIFIKMFLIFLVIYFSRKWLTMNVIGVNIHSMNVNCISLMSRNVSYILIMLNGVDNMKQLCVRVDDAVADRLKSAAEEERRSVADYIRGLILEDLERREEDK